MPSNFSIWEHFEAAPAEDLNDKQNKVLKSNNEQLGLFQSAESFWQLMNSLDHKELSNIFFNCCDNTLPIYKINNDWERIYALSIFRDDIEPVWENSANKNGAELELRLFGFGDLLTLEELWYDLIERFIVGDLSKESNLLGVRIIDRSDASGLYFRYEFWFAEKVDAENFKEYVQLKIEANLFKKGIKSAAKIVVHAV